MAEDARALDDRFAGVPTLAMLHALAADRLLARAAVVSSFGAESAVLLDLVARTDRSVPVVFVDTMRMFPETLRYREALVQRLGLEVITVQPDADRLVARDAAGERWSYDPDGCCALRKVEPLARALQPFDTWLSGRKAFQATTRRTLPRFEEEDGRLKINPLADWVASDLAAYARARSLPPHPLVERGYPSIGCMPCTSPVAPGEDARAGRWRGVGKTECGIHTAIAGREEP